MKLPALRAPQATPLSCSRERGRWAVPHWLSDPDLRDVVLGFEEAHLAHGGAGAIYVRLRRPKGWGEER